MSALISIEGILRTETGDPIPDGIKLFRVLSENYRIILSSDADPAKTEHWLRSHMIAGYGEFYDSSSFYVGQPLRQRHIDIERAKGKLELFIDSDPESCAYALSQGVVSILFASPKFVRVARSVRPWDDLQVEVERQKEALLDAHIGNSVKRFE